MVRRGAFIKGETPMYEHIMVPVDLSVRERLTKAVNVAADLAGWIEYLVASHGGKLASHAPISVFVVRQGG